MPSADVVMKSEWEYLSFRGDGHRRAAMVGDPRSLISTLSRSQYVKVLQARFLSRRRLSRNDRHGSIRNGN
jgi:hypothetical protein